MIWNHHGKLHWVSHDSKHNDAQVRVIDGVTHWCIINKETGVIVQSGETNQTLDAMRLCEDAIKS